MSFMILQVLLFDIITFALYECTARFWLETNINLLSHDAQSCRSWKTFETEINNIGDIDDTRFVRRDKQQLLALLVYNIIAGN